MTKIYMSDHGHTMFGRFHAILKIQNQKIEPCQIKEMFSYEDFNKLLKDVVFGNKICSEYLREDYVLVQDSDYYNEPYLNVLIKNCDFYPESIFGYQGVITSKDMLIKHNNGTTFYLKHKNDESMVTNERLSYLETLISKKKIDVWSEEKFVMSRRMYRAWDKSSLRLKDEEEIKLRVITEIFKKKKENSVFAVRGGGMHTLRLLMLLPYELRIKVNYIIDYDKECLAGRLGIKVISPAEVERYKIDEVLISSYDYRNEWKEEFANYKMKVHDIYDMFCEVGIVCAKEFYKRQYIPEDFILEN